MSGPFTQVISISDSHNFNGSGGNKILSIELTPGGFSFLAADSKLRVPVLLESFRTDDSANAYDYLSQLPDFFRQLPVLHENYERIHVVNYHSQFVIVPSALFLHTSKKAYLDFCSVVGVDTELHSDKISLLDAFGVYPVSEQLIKLLKQQFVQVQVKHSATIMIETALKWLSENPDGFQLLLHIKASVFEILLFEYGKLIYYNSFGYQTFSDLMYYVFYVLEQHKKDPGRLTVAIAGEVDTHADGYQYLSSYFRNVFMYYPSCLRHADKPLWGESGYRFFNLFSTALCE